MLRHAHFYMKGGFRTFAASANSDRLSAKADLRCPRDPGEHGEIPTLQLFQFATETESLMAHDAWVITSFYQ
jgi:hypothetical protein